MRYSSSKYSVTLRTGLGFSKSSKMAPFDRPYTTFYWSAIVSKYCSIWYRFWVIWRWMISWPWNLVYRSLKVIQTGTIRKLRCSFLFVFHSNYGSILHHLWDKARYWSKIVTFSYPLAFNAPVRGVPVGMFPFRLVWETRMVGLPDNEKTFEDMHNRLDSIPACDRRTDRHLATA